MSLTCVPVKIRPHLVKFLIDQFPIDRDAQYCGKRVVSVKIKSNSPIGKYIRSMCVKVDYPAKADNYNFFFSVNETESEGTVYGYKNGKYRFLELPEQFIDDLNELLEEVFRMNFTYFVEGFRMTGMYGSRREAIRLFIDRYDLFEYGFNMDTLEQIITRNSKGNNWSPLVQKAK